MKAAELAVSQEDCWRKIAISPTYFAGLPFSKCKRLFSLTVDAGPEWTGSL